MITFNLFVILAYLGRVGVGLSVSVRGCITIDIVRFICAIFVRVGISMSLLNSDIIMVRLGLDVNCSILVLVKPEWLRNWVMSASLGCLQILCGCFVRVTVLCLTSMSWLVSVSVLDRLRAITIAASLSW